MGLLILQSTVYRREVDQNFLGTWRSILSASRACYCNRSRFIGELLSKESRSSSLFRQVPATLCTQVLFIPCRCHSLRGWWVPPSIPEQRYQRIVIQGWGISSMRGSTYRLFNPFVVPALACGWSGHGRVVRSPAREIGLRHRSSRALRTIGGIVWFKPKWIEMNNLLAK
jgi:hypothetical protein